VELTVALVVESTVFALQELVELAVVVVAAAAGVVVVVAAVEAAVAAAGEVSARESKLHSRLRREQDEGLHLPVQPSFSLAPFVHFG
jgi:hypothetical protein